MTKKLMMKKIVRKKIVKQNRNLPQIWILINPVCLIHIIL